MIEYLACVIALMGFASFFGEGRVLFALVAISANWALNTVSVYAAGTTDPWWAFLPIDYVTALILLLTCERVCAWLFAVTAIYAFQCISHGVYGFFTQDTAARYYYYYTLSYSAWAQLFIIGGWVIAGRIGLSLRDILRVASLRAGFAKSREREGE